MPSRRARASRQPKPTFPASAPVLLFHLEACSLRAPGPCRYCPCLKPPCANGKAEPVAAAQRQATPPGHRPAASPASWHLDAETTAHSPRTAAWSAPLSWSRKRWSRSLWRETNSAGLLGKPGAAPHFQDGQPPPRQSLKSCSPAARTQSHPVPDIRGSRKKIRPSRKARREMAGRPRMQLLGGALLLDTSLVHPHHAVRHGKASS